MMIILEYILCYSSAFFLGMFTGFIVLYWAIKILANMARISKNK
mgnify:CR=1 FL=1|tara:strand:- start:23968 stop:24099 length:132 start_codon:yes stop_codon:yes gene_type:complete